MKNWIIPLFVFGFLIACDTDGPKGIHVEGELEYFGDKISKNGAISSDNFFDSFTEGDSIQLTLSGKINEVCKKKGCWMSMGIGEDKEMMVRFKDYGFFVPLNADGRMATVEGWAFKEVLSIEELKHYAFDANQTEEEIAAISSPKVSYTFMANGVIIE
ncbi:DUF4920 domain-containing protein [Chitinophagales bacterium]|jgi:hypothetical protein|nr:DUF4920 domain-containing protein [Chitinophagales bacterium]|tara:strand:- start:34671 stop:35147 length:477 start_codon:yes stop_codon:yes gene_type:complete